MFRGSRLQYQRREVSRLEKKALEKLREGMEQPNE